MLATALLLMAATLAHAQQGTTDAGCRGPEYSVLDFWVGRWDVHLADESRKKVGTNVIEKTLEGCAIFEHWSDVLGSAGKSLFYYHRAESVWKQVWVTDIGRIKEKRAVAPDVEGTVRFQGEVRLPDGTRVLDRTTLTPMGGSVRQLIEQSSDGGKTWKPTFDAIYTRSK